MVPRVTAGLCLAGLAVLCLPAEVDARPPACKRLTGEQRVTADALLAKLHPYDCCDGTLASCLQGKRVCRLAWRLAENVCGRVSRGQDRATIERALSRRARSMMPVGAPAAIDLTGVPIAGEAEAPVLVVTYACARCPYCSKLVPALHREVTSGALKGKARLAFKVFPIRGHEHSTEAGLAFQAAAEMGRFWEYADYTYARFDAFCPKKQGEWAAAVGLDRTRFEARVVEPSLRTALVASKKEGILNKVEATPTLFIGGHKYHGGLEIEEVVDVVEEAYERTKGLEYR